MNNVNLDILEYQRKVIEKIMPESWNFWQVDITGSTHPAGLDLLLKRVPDDIVIILDIDCVPLKHNSFEYLYSYAKEGMLVGAIQKANHIQNNNHLYVGPFCMAFSLKKYQELGSPSFIETRRGDVGEELTYIWQANGEEVKFMWPSSVATPLWFLTQKEMFGYGTKYSDTFYHQFCSREQQGTQQFINECKKVIESNV